MTTPCGKFIIVLIIPMIFLWGCTHESTSKQDLGLLPDQPESVLVQDASSVPQTLEPAPRSQATQSTSPEIVDSLSASLKPTTRDATIQQAAESNTGSTSSQSPTNSSPQLTGKAFGEFPGVSSHWKERKQQLAIQLQEHSQKMEELKMKLQLIDQVAEHVSFITKAYVAEQNYFLMEFTIENRASFAIKDISISCDQIAPTGTIIRSHAETIYDIIKPSTRSAYAPIPYGNKHRQTQSLQCQITNFVVEKANPEVS